MDQTTPKPPLSQQVKECLDANMSLEDGSKYVNFYHNGYTLIARLIRIQQQHTDPTVRAKAQSYLDDIDLNGGIGMYYRAAYRFSMLNQIKAKVHRPKGDRGKRKLTRFEHIRIAEFAVRSDLSEDEHSEIKRIQASIMEDKIASVDYEKLKQISAKYRPVIHHGNSKRGWTTIDEKTYSDIQVLLDRPDVSDTDKKRVYKLMEGIQEGKMPTIDFFDIGEILSGNKASKKELAKRQTASKTFENAVFMACQACDNLEDMRVPVLPRSNRVDLVTMISAAAVNLLQLQNQLLHEEEEEESEDGRHQRSIRSREKPLSDLGPVSAPIPGEPRQEDRS